MRTDPASGRLLDLEMTPMQIGNFRLRRASAADVKWLAGMLDREGRAFGTSVVRTEENRLLLRWKE